MAHRTARPARPCPRALPAARGCRARRGFPVAARVLAVAGVLVVAGGVGYVVAQSSSPNSTSSAGSNAAAPAASAQSHPAFRGPVSSNSPAQGSGTFTVTRSGTTYHPRAFSHQAATVMAHSSTGLIRPGSQPGGSRRPSPALTGCVTSVVGAGRAGEVKLVDQARYRGHPATIIVVTASATQPAEVYVARCSGSRAVVLARAPLP